MSWDPYESNSYYSNNSWADELYGRDAMDSWRESNSYDDSDFSSYFSSSSSLYGDIDWSSSSKSHSSDDDFSLSEDTAMFYDYESDYDVDSNNYKHRQLTPEEEYRCNLNIYKNKWLAEYHAYKYYLVKFDDMTEHMKACEFYNEIIDYERKRKCGLTGLSYKAKKDFIDTNIMPEGAFTCYVGYMKDYFTPDDFLHLYLTRPRDEYAVFWGFQKNSCVVFYPTNDTYSLYYYREKDDEGNSVIGVIQNISREEFVNIELTKKLINDLWVYDEDKINNLYNDDRNIVVASKPEYIFKMMLEDYHLRGCIDMWYNWRQRKNDCPMSEYYQLALKKGSKKFFFFDNNLKDKIRDICNNDTSYRYWYVLSMLKEIGIIYKDFRIV